MKTTLIPAAFCFFASILSFLPFSDALEAGDIAIVQYQSDNPDIAYFVALVDIATNETIHFTDNGVFTNGNLATSEGSQSWTALSDVSAGALVELNFTTHTSLENGAIVHDLTQTSSGLALSTAGDQLLAYQGNTGSPVFIAAFHANGAWEFDRTSASTSAEPSGLAKGQSLAIEPEKDNQIYNCSITSGTKTILLNALNDMNNWVGSDFIQPRFSCAFNVAPPGFPQGHGCSNDVECDAGFCTDGICCENACGGGSNDCQACNSASTGAADGICAPTILGSPCGDGGTECSGQDLCDGNGVCLINDLPLGTLCGDAASECSGQDTCDGGGTCQPNDKAPGFLCGEGANACSDQDTCDGNGLCQTHDLSSGTLCGDAPNDCSDQDTCDGGGICQPNDRVIGTQCGNPESACSDQDLCDGAGICEPRHKALGVLCGDGANACSGQDFCDGNGFCQPNDLPLGTLCGEGPTECSAQDSCDGFGSCQFNHLAQGIACGDSNATDCDDADVCDGNGRCDPKKVPLGTACGDAASECSDQDTCNGVGTCLSNDRAEGTPCGDGANRSCSAADTCDGSGICEENHISDGTPCQTGTFCLRGDVCLSGVCVEGNKPTCLVGEKCIEASFSCIQSCGDGILDDGEMCDDGEMNSDIDPDGCRIDCRTARCGDGVVDPSLNEACDSGSMNSDLLPDACRMDCQEAHCGDGVVDRLEGCDEGEENADEPGARCRLDCSLASCGDGILDPGEECDEGEDNSDEDADGCRTMCKFAFCGDDIIDTGEVCDGGPDCSSSCEAIVEVEDMGGDLLSDMGTDSGPDPKDLIDPIPIGKGVQNEEGCGCSSRKSNKGSIVLMFIGLFFIMRRKRKRS